MIMATAVGAGVLAGIGFGAGIASATRSSAHQRTGRTCPQVLIKIGLAALLISWLPRRWAASWSVPRCWCSSLRLVMPESRHLIPGDMWRAR
jgi:hypothetical protein